MEGKEAKVGPKTRVVTLVSAGGVVYKREDGQVHVVLCGRTQPARWSLPKGTPDEGETIEQTALREAREETGLDVLIEQPIGKIDYWFVRPTDGARCHKTVHFYLMVPVGGSVEGHDPEFDEVRWFPAEEAITALTYASEASVVTKAISLISQGLKE